MNISILPIRKWRWDLLGLGIASLVLELATIHPSAYFLHFDTPTQDYMAAMWLQNCWEHITEKMLPVLLLAPFFRAFGPSPYWETLWLLIAATASLVVVYELARLFSNSRLAGLTAILLLAALPTFQYFSRMHLGYPMPFLLLGWLMIRHKRWAWAGACFGLAVIAHYNSWVPVGLSVLALAIFSRPDTWKSWLILGLAFALPLLAIDGLFFFYDGIVFEWNRSVFTEIFRLSELGASEPHSNWLWVSQTAVSSNGLILTLILAFGNFAPLILFRRDKTGVALSLTFIAMAALYTVQAGLGRAFLVSRVLASSYPFWAIGSAIVLTKLIDSLRQASLRRISAGAAIIGLVGAITHAAIFIYQFTQTPYPRIEQVFMKAAKENRPVRHEGNRWIPLFFAQIYGVELLTNDSRWIAANAPGQAILIFENKSPAELRHENYQIETIELNSEADAMYAGLTGEAAIPRLFDIWWPAGTSDPIGKLSDMPQYSTYYVGSGCVTPPLYINKTLYFYQLAWQKLMNWLGLK